MDSLLYYQICFLVSVALSFAYICLWHEGINVYMTGLFILLPIVCLGCVWMYWAPSLEIAILSNKLVYLAGCFWPLFGTKAILSLCNLKIPKVYTVIAFILSFVFYGFALTSDRPGPLYRSISYLEIDGRVELYPEYGWMHTVIYAVMVLYILIGIVALIYGMKNKVRASIKNMWLMIVGEIIVIVVFFIYGIQKLAGSPAILYVTSQLIFLIAGYRSYYYNIDNSVMDTIKAEGKIGYITFDRNKRLLACNEVAERYFPELKTARTDMPLDNLDGIKKTLSDCLDTVEKTGHSAEQTVPCGDLFVRIKVDEYATHLRKNIYRVFMDDVSDHENLIQLLNTEKKAAEDEKNHLSETFHRYIDPNIAETLLRKNSAEADKGSERSITVMFADIRGFTTYSENRNPREVLSLLNMVIETVTSCVMANNGIVDKIIGDCVKGIWDDPADEKRSVYNACRAAVDIQKSMDELALKTKEQFGAELHMGIGINFGTAIVGNVGTSRRSDYTAIGDAVNVANRLESIAGPDEILLTSDTAGQLDGRGKFSVFNTNVVLRGRSNRTYILRLDDIE